MWYLATLKPLFERRKNLKSFKPTMTTSEDDVTFTNSNPSLRFTVTTRRVMTTYKKISNNNNSRLTSRCLDIFGSVLRKMFMWFPLILYLCMIPLNLWWSSRESPDIWNRSRGKRSKKQKWKTKVLTWFSLFFPFLVTFPSNSQSAASIWFIVQFFQS